MPEYCLKFIKKITLRFLPGFVRQLLYKAILLFDFKTEYKKNRFVNQLGKAN